MNQRHSSILEHGFIAASGPIMVFSLYLLFAGHNQPGGGFAGGLVAGVAVALAWSVGGLETVRLLIPLRSAVLLGTGLMVSTLTGFVPLVAGLSYLESASFEMSIPLIGDVKVVSALAFDVGVYLVVVGMILGLVQALGKDETVEGEMQ